MARSEYRRTALGCHAKLAAQANEALRLAQTRYDAGLGSIVELSQAQLNQTSAEIQNATARYDYLSGRAALRLRYGRAAMMSRLAGPLFLLVFVI